LNTSALERAFHAGNYPLVLSAIRDPQTAFEARLLLNVGARQRDWDLVDRAAQSLQRLGDDSERVLGKAYSVLAERAQGHSARSLDIDPSGVDRRTAADVAYIQGLLAWAGRDSEAARRALRSVSPVTVEQRVKIIALQSWFTTNLARRADMLMAALSQAIEGAVDVGLLGHIAHPLAVLVRELDLGDLGQRAEDLLGRVPWGEQAPADRYYTDRAVAWVAAQRGDYISALRLLDRTALRALNPAQCAVVATDRVRICTMAGDTVNAHVAALHAFEELELIAWDRAVNDEPYAVYSASDVLAPIDRERMRALVTRADAASLSPVLGAASLPTLPAFRDLAHALLETDSYGSLRFARRAYRAFHNIGYEHRAASAALCAYDASRARHWMEKAESIALKTPRSILAREVARRSSVLRHVTPRRRELLTAIAEHLTNREIATRLSISENTVKEHIRVLHRLFKVSRRAELAALWQEAKEVA